MRRVKYKEFKDQVKKDSIKALRVINRRAPRRKPRDLDEVNALIRLAKISWESAIASGKLQQKGDRRYSLKVYAE